MKDQLQILRKTVEGCKRCRLCKGAKHAVFGEGSPLAEIFFVGEAPGRQEDLQGKPFVGAAGKFLNEMLASIGFRREQVFITNIVKHRPPNNRDPLPDEIEACSPYLLRQLAMIHPKLIVPLGRHALERFLPGLKISHVHGQAKRAKGILPESFVFFPLYHPAAALYNPGLRATLFKDFQKIPKVLKKISSL